MKKNTLPMEAMFPRKHIQVEILVAVKSGTI